MYSYNVHVHVRCEEIKDVTTKIQRAPVNAHFHALWMATQAQDIHWI